MTEAKYLVRITLRSGQDIYTHSAEPPEVNLRTNPPKVRVRHAPASPGSDDWQVAHVCPEEIAAVCFTSLRR